MAGLLDRAVKTISSGVKGMTAANGLVPSSIYRGGFGLTDYSYNVDARNAYMTLSSVIGCVGAYCKNACQVKFIVKHLDGTPWPDHPLQWLIQHPNDDMSEKRIALYNAVYKPLGGASRLMLYRNDKDQIIGWRPYSTAEIVPVPLTNARIGRNSWIDSYWHRPVSGAPEQIAQRNILNLTFHSVNPLIPQNDMSPLQAAFLDINADKEITKLPLDLLRSSAFLSMVLTLGNGAENLPDDAYETIKGDLEKGWSGDNKFRPMLLRTGGKAEFVGVNFRALAIDELAKRPESRICVALDVPIRYMGFIAGIDASTSDNFVASWLAFVKGPITTGAQLDCDVMTMMFTRENWQNHPVAILYGLDRKANSEFVIEPDMSDVEALKTESFARHMDARANYTTGAIKTDEFRADIDKPPLGGEDGDAYYEGPASNDSNDKSRMDNVMNTPKPKE